MPHDEVGDIPGVEVKPPDIVLFVCKLDQVTQDEDFYTIFSCFGTVELAEIIRDLKTGDSLCYAFIDFEAKEACEHAYFKVDNCLIDDPIGSMLILVKVFQNCGVSSEKANEMQIKIWPYTRCGWRTTSTLPTRSSIECLVCPTRKARLVLPSKCLARTWSRADNRSMMWTHLQWRRTMVC